MRAMKPVTASSSSTSAGRGSVEYFYTPPDHIGSDQLVIEGEEFAHLTHVMRRRVGDAIRVVDGVGATLEATIREINNRQAHCIITARFLNLNEPPVRIHLGVAILKNSSKFDFLVEKTTELGVAEITPLLTERTIPRHAKTDRWQKVALAAMKQSGRSVLPRIHSLTPLHEFVALTPTERLRLMPHEKTEGSRIAQALGEHDGKDITLCIGPEGGFTVDEVTLGERAGFLPVSLGPRRLRTETAAIVSVALASS